MFQTPLSLSRKIVEGFDKDGTIFIFIKMFLSFKNVLYDNQGTCPVAQRTERRAFVVGSSNFRDAIYDKQADYTHLLIFVCLLPK